MASSSRMSPQNAQSEYQRTSRAWTLVEIRMAGYVIDAERLLHVVRGRRGHRARAVQFVG